MIVGLVTPAWVWYLMRGSGLVALVLLTLTVALGVTGVTRWQSSCWSRVVTAGLHRNLSLLAMCFLAIHVLTASLDSWIGLGWLGVVVPFHSHYRPLWVGLGVVSADLLVAVVATSLLRRHVGYRAWRALHTMAWLMWPLAFVHALGSGTDIWSIWGLAIAGSCLAVVVAAAVWRLRTRGASSPRGSAGAEPVTVRQSHTSAAGRASGAAARPLTSAGRTP